MFNSWTHLLNIHNCLPIPMHTFIVHRYGEALLLADINCTFITADISQLFKMYLNIDIILLNLLLLFFSMPVVHLCLRFLACVLQLLCSTSQSRQSSIVFLISLRVVVATWLLLIFLHIYSRQYSCNALAHQIKQQQLLFSATTTGNINSNIRVLHSHTK